MAAKGAAGLVDRGSRPLRCPRRCDASKLERAAALRRTQQLNYECIAERVGLSKSTVGRACKAADVARRPALEPGAAVRRYERKSAGDLLHIDSKTLARFEQPGHRVPSG